MHSTVSSECVIILKQEASQEEVDFELVLKEKKGLNRPQKSGNKLENQRQDPCAQGSWTPEENLGPRPSFD